MAFKDVLDLVEVAFHPNCKKNTQPMYFAAFYSMMTFMIDMKTVSKWILEEFLIVDYPQRNAFQDLHVDELLKSFRSSILLYMWHLHN